jgi:hypothetical protein
VSIHWIRFSGLKKLSSSSLVESPARFTVYAAAICGIKLAHDIISPIPHLEYLLGVIFFREK